MNTNLDGNNSCYMTFSRSNSTLYLYRDSDSSWLPLALGSQESVSNSRCSIAGASLAQNGSGNEWTFTIQLSLLGQLNGERFVYVSVHDSTNLPSPWTTAAKWSLTPAAGPTVVSVSPSSGTNTSQVFTVTFDDANGYEDIGEIKFLVNTKIGPDGGCFVSFTPGANTLSLYRDTDQTWLPVSAGSDAVVSNGQCSVSRSGFSMTGSGRQLTIMVPISFKSSFVGKKSLYAHATDRTGLNSGWSTAGTWDIAAPGPPSIVSFSPSRAGAMSQVYELKVSDPGGPDNVSIVQLIFNTVLNAYNGCYIIYDRPTNQFHLFRESDGAWPFVTSGSSASISNGKCSLSGNGLSAVGSGNTLTLKLPITFSSQYTGPKNIYTGVTSSGGLSSGFVNSGSWSAGQSSPPTVVSVNPSTGTASSQTFQLTLNDGNGSDDISVAYLLISSQLDMYNSCVVGFDRSANTFYLFDDHDWRRVAADTGPVTNGRCTVSGAGVSASASGNSLMLTVPISLAAGWPGQKKLFGYAADGAGLNSGWIQRGSWTVGN